MNELKRREEDKLRLAGKLLRERELVPS